MKEKIIVIISVILLAFCIVIGSCSAAVIYSKSKQKKEDTENTISTAVVEKIPKKSDKIAELTTSSSEIPEAEGMDYKATDSLPSTGDKIADKTKKSAEKKYVDLTDLENAKAQGFVDMKKVDTSHLENYFQSYPISDKLFDRIYGDDRSYKTYCTVARESLAYIKVLHYDYKGEVRVGELIASTEISDDLIYIFKTLFENKYQIEKMVLVEAYAADDDASVNDNNTSCFNFRYATDSTVLSNHATGRAIDINPLQNPYFRVYEDGSYDWDNVDAELYWDRSKDPEKRHMITHEDLCYQLFAERGFAWGGDWQNPIDYQHFEK